MLSELFLAVVLAAAPCPDCEGTGAFRDRGIIFNDTYRLCVRCDGTGTVPPYGNPWIVCRQCKGAGKAFVVAPYEGDFPKKAGWESCPTCKGMGSVPNPRMPTAAKPALTEKITPAAAIAGGFLALMLGLLALVIVCAAILVIAYTRRAVKPGSAPPPLAPSG